MKTILFAIIILNLTATFAQNSDSSRLHYVQPASSKFGIKAIAGYNNLVFNIKGKQDISYQSQKNYKAGLGISYKKIGINLLTNVFNPSDTSFSKSNNFDIRTSVYTNRLIFDLNFHLLNGFYAPNIYETGEQIQIVKKPSISYIFTDLNIIYSLNNKISYKAAFVQSERQLKSAGSTVIMLNVAFSKLNNRTNGLVPENQYFSFGDESKLQKGAFTSSAAMGGYACAFVSKNFWFTNVLISGFGAQYQIYYLAVQKYIVWSPVVKVNYKTSIGYSVNNWYVCVIGNADLSFSKIRKAAFQTFLYSGVALIGYKF